MRPSSADAAKPPARHRPVQVLAAACREEPLAQQREEAAQGARGCGQAAQISPVVAESGESNCCRTERASGVQAALDSLPHGLRAPLVFREYGGLAYREIGAMLGITENNVKVRVFRARERLERRSPRESPCVLTAISCPPSSTARSTPRGARRSRSTSAPAHPASRARPARGRAPELRREAGARLAGPMERVRSILASSAARPPAAAPVASHSRCPVPLVAAAAALILAVGAALIGVSLRVARGPWCASPGPSPDDGNPHRRPRGSDLEALLRSMRGEEGAQEERHHAAEGRAPDPVGEPRMGKETDFPRRKPW